MKRLIFSKKFGLKIQEFALEDNVSKQGQELQGQELQGQELQGQELQGQELQGQALVEVYYSGINYKDALGVCGKAPIFKKDPIVPGIDMAGVALTGVYKGQEIIAQGCSLGEVFDGGYTQKALVDESLLIPRPEGLSLKESMTLGTAGFTAALAYYRMKQNGQTPDKGPILVSGATGGVGGFATQIFSQNGYEVCVVTHRKGFKDKLMGLGANNVFMYDELFPKFSSKQRSKPLEKIKWGGVIDNLGGEFLESVLPQISLWGNVCSIGLAKGGDFNTFVMPFILRGVSLLGVSSNNCTMDIRKDLWKGLGGHLKPQSLLDQIHSEVTLEGVLEASKKILDHKSQGRVLVDVKSS